MSKQITITIDGPQGSGKSTVARYLASVLAQNGVPTRLSDNGQTVPFADKWEVLPDHFDADVTINVEQK